jgi:hypothetical protein
MSFIRSHLPGGEKSPTELLVWTRLKVVIFTTRNTNIYTKFENFTARAIFSSFYKNSQPNFAIFILSSMKTLVLAVVLDFVPLALIKI